MPPYSTIILSKNGTILAKMNEEIKKVKKNQLGTKKNYNIINLIQFIMIIPIEI